MTGRFVLQAFHAWQQGILKVCCGKEHLMATAWPFLLFGMEVDRHGN
jgi:hypothetical protein